jgi:hypothetical protein
MKTICAFMVLLFTVSTLPAAIIWTESFESPDQSADPDGATNTIPTGWTGGGGIMTDTLSGYDTPYGSQWVWTNDNVVGLLSDATLDNTVTGADTIGALLQEGTYTLTFNVAHRLSTQSTYLVDLLANGVSIGTVSGTLTTTDFSSSDSIVAVIGSTHAQLGTDLQVRLRTNGAGNQNYQPQFDNLQLDFVAIPEPSSFALLSLAGLLLFTLRRRRRA